MSIDERAFLSACIEIESDRMPPSKEASGWFRHLVEAYEAARASVPVSEQPDEWTKDVLEILEGRHKELLFNYETHEYGQDEAWKTAADNVKRLIDTAPNREVVLAENPTESKGGSE